MYRVGELILYGNLGVCRVENIVERCVDGIQKNFYELHPIYQTCVVYTPVDNKKVFMRQIITRSQAEELIDSIVGIRPDICHIKAASQLSDYYEHFIDSHDCAELVKLTMSIYAKKKAAEHQHKKVGAVDERYMKKAEELLFGELAAALDIPRDGVREYIEKRIGKAEPYEW